MADCSWRVLAFGGAIFDPKSIFDPVMSGLRSHFSKIDNFSTLHAYISNTMNLSDLKLHQRIPRSILNKIGCYIFLTGYLWRIASRKGAASHSSPKSPEGKLVQWRWLTSDSVKRHYKHLYVKIIHVFGLITSRNPKNPRQISHYR